MASLTRDHLHGRAIRQGSPQHTAVTRRDAPLIFLEPRRGVHRTFGAVTSTGERDPSRGRGRGYFRDVIAESFRPDDTFMNAVTICRFEPHGALVVRNLDLLQVTPRTFTSRAIPDREALVALVEERFGIPAGIVAEAVGALRDLRDAWG